jgi:hypothetical protein
MRGMGDGRCDDGISNRQIKETRLWHLLLLLAAILLDRMGKNEKTHLFTFSCIHICILRTNKHTPNIDAYVKPIAYFNTLVKALLVVGSREKAVFSSLWHLTNVYAYRRAHRAMERALRSRRECRKSRE